MALSTIPARAVRSAVLAAALAASTAAAAGDEGTPPRVQLGPGSTLTQWKAADAADRSRVAVELARKRLGNQADRLELAKTAMEITGCVSRTATDARFGSWKVDATAATCLSAPEKPGSSAPSTLPGPAATAPAPSLPAKP